MRRLSLIVGMSFLLFPISVSAEEAAQESTCEYSNGMLICHEQQKEKKKLENDEHAKQVEEDEKNGLEDEESEAKKKAVKKAEKETGKKIEDIRQVEQDDSRIKIREVISDGVSTYHIQILDTISTAPQNTANEDKDILVIDSLNYSILELLPDVVLTQDVMNTLLWLLMGVLSVFVITLCWWLHKRTNVRK